jgi:Mn2+/Fe2+ NRAMP family transporter
MNWVTRTYYRLQRWWKAFRLFLIISGPGMVVMIADNDAGGITTYAATGAKFEYYLIWFLVLLGPVAYFEQEMTVRLGAVTKRGHARAGQSGGKPRRLSRRENSGIDARLEVNHADDH